MSPVPRPDSLLVAVLLTLSVGMGPMATDFYLPALPTIGASLTADVATVQLTLSVFLAGFALAQLVYGPLSDRYGRRPALLTGFGLFTLASIGCAVATSIEMLIVARFLQALGACAGPVLGRTVVRDVYGTEGAARMLAYIGAAMALAPLIGPIIGGYLTVWFGWRANFVVLTLYGAMTFLGVLLALAETNPQLGETTGPVRMLRDYLGFLRHRIYVGYVLCHTATYCGLFAFISGSSFVFIEVLGLRPNRYGLCFGAAVAGYIVGAIVSGRIVRHLGLERMVPLGASICAAGGLAMAGLVLAGIETVWSVLGPMMVYMFGVGFVLPNAMAGALGPFPTRAGAASALLGFTQMGLAALVGIAVGAAFDGTARPMAVTIALSGLAAMLVHRGLVRGAAGAR
ncbi:MAG: multidrug effflux MFS transporter [Rhodospirillales bacterium]|nr:MAG: multidrug effflux MFS transporter [Rhodospirillales bacterium]